MPWLSISMPRHRAKSRLSRISSMAAFLPTADHQILPNGTAFVTDAGMTGDYDSVIGMEKEEAHGIGVMQDIGVAIKIKSSR